MSSSILYWLSQFGILGIIILCFFHAYKKHNIILLLFLLIDAFLFEFIILQLYNAVEYNSTLITFGGIPLMVPAGWAVLLYSLLKTVESDNVHLKSIFIAQAMVSIDLVLDKVAVANGLWSWKNPIGYFGIPYDNFFAWYIYSFVTVFFISILLTKISFINILRVFFLISISGLSLGYVWTFLPIAFQPIFWWVIFISTWLVILMSFHKLEFKLQNIYLLTIPFIFYLFALLLILLNWSALSEYYIFLSLLFFVFWLSLIAWKLGAINYLKKMV